jgi:hypothetical protein
MNEERTGKGLQQVEHIRGHLWHRYSIAVNQVMVATVKLSKWWLQLNYKICSFFDKHTSLRSKGQRLFARNQEIVSEWSDDMSTPGQ